MWIRRVNAPSPMDDGSEAWARIAGFGREIQREVRAASAASFRAWFAARAKNPARRIFSLALGTKREHNLPTWELSSHFAVIHRLSTTDPQTWPATQRPVHSPGQSRDKDANTMAVILLSALFTCGGVFAVVTLLAGWRKYGSAYRMLRSELRDCPQWREVRVTVREVTVRSDAVVLRPAFTSGGASGVSGFTGRARSPGAALPAAA